MMSATGKCLKSLETLYQNSGRLHRLVGRKSKTKKAVIFSTGMRGLKTMKYLKIRLVSVCLLVFFSLAPQAFALEFTTRGTKKNLDSLVVPQQEKAPSSEKRTVGGPRTCTKENREKAEYYKKLIEDHNNNVRELSGLDPGDHGDKSKSRSLIKKKENFYAFLRSDGFLESRTLFKACRMQVEIEPDTVRPFWMPDSL
jgi:hypothetical protein